MSLVENNNNNKQTLKEKIHSAGFNQIQPTHKALISINDAGLYYSLCDEAIRNISHSKIENLIVIGDSETMMQLTEIEKIFPNITKIITFGNVPSNWDIPVEYHVPPPFFQPADRILILVSPMIALAFLGTITNIKNTNNHSNFDGAWSYHHQYIRHLLQLFTPTLLAEYTPSKEHLEQIIEITTRIMSFHSNMIVGHESSIELDKNELATVLEILKAISSKKHARDVLYVFVEQISHVVPSDRCSIVRVWGQEDVVHVLASHDDANLYDITVPLVKYPEIRKALSIGNKVVINNVKQDPITQPCLESLIKKGINSILVIPIILYDPEVGSLLLRAVRREATFSLQEINFFEIVTNAAANALEKAQLFETVQEANKKLEQLAITDGLTGIYNHRYFRERLEEEVLRSLRYNLPLSCALFDIDDFKKCNDNYGHLFGDAVLKEIALRIQQAVRRTDIVARYGGEEFIIIMPQTTLDGAYIQAERIRKIIKEKPFEHMGKKINITISGGVAEVVQNEVLSVEDLLRIADQCLYRAKREGKNKVIAPKNVTLNQTEE